VSAVEVYERRCAVIVVSFQSEAVLGLGVQSLVDAGLGAATVIVDNASLDGSAQVARSFAAAGVTVVEESDNTGFAGGCNRGFAVAPREFPYLAFMNPDVRVSVGCLDRCLRVMERRPEVGCVAPLLLRPGGVTVDSAGQVLHKLTLEVEDRGYGRPAADLAMCSGNVLAACGALAVFRRRALEDVCLDNGPWDERFFCFWEDLEIGWRLTNAGWKVVFEPGAVAEHVRGAGAQPGTGPLRWRRPVELEACIVSNRWMTLIRHLHFLDLLPRIPILLGRDILTTGAGMLRRPALAWHLGRRLPLVMKTLKERRGGMRKRLAELAWSSG